MKLRSLISTIAVALAACAGYAPSALPEGSSEADVKQAMGEPTGRYALAGGGQRLEYARGPYGRHTYMVDLDALGRLIKWEQVLDVHHFAAVMPGLTRDEVLRTIGRPGERMGMMRDGQIWSWRYANNDCLWYQAQFDAQGIVTTAGYGTERGCDGDNKRSARMMMKH
jgi:hypothetical protein